MLAGVVGTLLEGCGHQTPLCSRGPQGRHHNEGGRTLSPDKLVLACLHRQMERAWLEESGPRVHLEWKGSWVVSFWY